MAEHTAHAAARFVPALELSRAFYVEVVEPLVRPFRHAAALLGWGSDVLGNDTERSTDHGWGPRLQIFVEPRDVASARAAVDTGLPETFRGWPVVFGWEDPDPRHTVRPRHFVEVSPLGAWLVDQLAIDPRAGLDTVDWLVLPQQSILGVVRGAVYADPDGMLADVRTRLDWYPDQVWRWLLACQWRRIGQEEHLIGRAAEVGDERGSRVAAARQVRELIRLGFLIERSYWPYTKWLGTEFGKLPIADRVAPALDQVLAAPTYPDRETGLCTAYEALADEFNRLELTDPLDTAVRPFFARPFRVLEADRFVRALEPTVTDPRLSDLPLIGAVDQFVDSTDVLSSAARARTFRAVFEGAASSDRTERG